MNRRQGITVNDFSGPQKAALMLVTMGPEAAAAVFRSLDPDDVDFLTREVAGLGDVPSEVRDQILEEFDEMMLAHSYLTEGGMQVAREILTKAMGADRAAEILERVRNADETGVFHKLNQVDQKQLVSFLQNEHPQTVALIMVKLKPQAAAVALASLPPEVQPDVVKRMATMEQISPSMLAEIQSVLQKHLKTMTRASSNVVGGVHTAAEILNLVDRATEKNILGVMDRENPELAVAIKNLMFVFEDILLLGDREIQRILKDVDSRDLAVSLKLASDEVKEKIFNNLSQRASDMLKDELEFLGPVRVKSVEEAQRKIVDVVRRLDESGEIQVNRGGAGEELVV